MVGVAGKSKACNTCKQRKIACDLEKPQCRQCIKSNRVCTGYQRERIFIVNQGPGKELPKNPAPEKPRGIDDSSGAGPKKDSVALSLRSKKHTRPSSIRSRAQETTIVKNISPQSLYRQQLLSEFLGRVAPVDDRTLQLGRKKEKGWPVLVAELPTLTKALETSILAVYTASLGRVHADEALVNEGSRYYVQGLWELQKALWDPKLMYKDETLAACMALFTYELMECPTESRSGFISHMDGCGRLIQLRGAAAHCSALGHELFLSFRLDGIMRALDQQRSTYLSDPEWMEIPWKYLSKTPLDQITDVLANVANLVGEASKMSHLEPTEVLPALLETANRCWKMDAEVQLVYEELESNYLGPLYWSKFSTEDNPADDPELGHVFPVAFHFLNLRMAQTCMMYWTTLLLLSSILSRVYQVLAAMNFNTSSLPLLEHRLDIASLSRNICQSLEYCMQDEMRGLGPAIALLPLSVVIEILKGHSSFTRELLWAKETVEKIKRRGSALT